MSWTDIVNKGSQTWWIVQNNQPTGAGMFCNAVPDVDDWNTLSDGYQAGYTFPLKRKVNPTLGLFDVELPVIDIEFSLKREYGNQYRKQGMFLRTVWTEVPKCNVLDGFNVSISFACGNPWNDNPNGKPPWPAAMINVEMVAHITTPNWTKTVDKWKYYIQYNGNLVGR